MLFISMMVDNPEAAVSPEAVVSLGTLLGFLECDIPPSTDNLHFPPLLPEPVAKKDSGDKREDGDRVSGESVSRLISIRISEERRRGNVKKAGVTDIDDGVSSAEIIGVSGTPEGVV